REPQATSTSAMTDTDAAILVVGFARDSFSPRFNTGHWSPARCRFASNVALQQQRTGHQPAAGGDDPDARVLHLTFSAIAAKLARALDHVTDRVQPAPRKASAVRI